MIDAAKDYTILFVCGKDRAGDLPAKAGLDLRNEKRRGKGCGAMLGKRVMTGRNTGIANLIRGQTGQALVSVLLLLVVGGIVVTPTLHLMGTGVWSGRAYEQKIGEIHAADAGVEDALWHIRNDHLDELLGAGYNQYDYSSSYDYPYLLSVNDKDVAVSIQNIWIPKDVPAGRLPTASEAKQIIEDEKLIIVGYPSSTTSTYTIKMVFDWATTTERDNLRVKTIGIWLSPGFEYSEYSGSCSLQGQSFYSAPSISLYKGGQAVVWTFSSQPLLKNFPNAALGPPLVVTFTFKYTGPQGQIPELVSSWVDTTGVSGVTYSWDDSIRLYKILSQAGGIQVEAYGAKTKFRRLKSTISADYAVAGNRLTEATATSGNDRYYRNRLYAESTSTIQRISLQSIPPSGIVPAGYIPEEAIIDTVYLYWSGWIDYRYWYQSGSSYYWGEIADLKYGSRTETQLIANSKVDRVKFGVGSNAQTVVADKWKIVGITASQETWARYSWMYSCFKDVTNLVVSGNTTVREYIENVMKSDGAGTVTFTVGHADEVRGNLRGSPYQNYNFALYNIGQSTGYPLATPAHKRPDEGYQTRYQWSYAGWSLIIFYRSPGVAQRQLYLYGLGPRPDDNLFVYRSYLGGDGDPSFTIAGFLAPPAISENDKSHLTYFVGEGDYHYSGDKIKVNTKYLSDANNPENNVFNSRSNALPTLVTDGVDVDTFVLPTGCILPYDTSATITLVTDQEIYTLIYVVLAFRSDLTTGGIITNYSVRLS